MKATVKKIWGIGWRLTLYLTAIAIIMIAILLCWAYNDHKNRHYSDKQLSETVRADYFHNRNEVRIYNRMIGKYTLKKLQWVANAPAKDSLTVFCRNGKRGFLNVNTGELVIAEQYRRAWIFSEGVAAVMKDGKIGFVNSRNETVLPFEYDYAGRNGMAIDYLFRSGYCTMTNAKGACGLIDRTGKWVIDAQYDCIWPPHEGKYRIVKDGDKYGLLNEKLEFIFPIEYDYIEYSNEKGIYLSKDGYKWQADYDGTVLNPFVCDQTDYVNYVSGYDTYTSKDSYGDENRIAEQVYTLSDYLIYTINNKCGIVRKDNGKVIIPALYNQINMVSPVLFEAQDYKDGKWVFIDIHGRIVEK
jgi:hypothetical protein